MSRRGNKTLWESALLLALMGIVAGAAGGFAIGIATTPKPATASSSGSK